MAVKAAIALVKKAGKANKGPKIDVIRFESVPAVQEDQVEIAYEEDYKGHSKANYEGQKDVSWYSFDWSYEEELIEVVEEPTGIDLEASDDEDLASANDEDRAKATDEDQMSELEKRRLANINKLKREYEKVFDFKKENFSAKKNSSSTVRRNSLAPILPPLTLETRSAKKRKKSEEEENHNNNNSIFKFEF